MDPKGPETTWGEVNTAIKEMPNPAKPEDYLKVAETIGTPTTTAAVQQEYVTPVNEAVASLPTQPSNKDYLDLAATLRSTVPAESDTTVAEERADITAEKLQPKKVEPGIVERIMNKIRGI